MSRTDPGSKALAFLVEGLIQAYLDLVEEAKFAHNWHRPATSKLITEMRASTAFLPAAANLKRLGLNAAWSLRQGGFIVPKEILKQACAVCGRLKNKMRLERAGDLFGRRLCTTHYRAQQREDPVWLAGRPCVRCDRPRGYKKTNFTGRGARSVCHQCTKKYIAARRPRGKPLPRFVMPRPSPRRPVDAPQRPPVPGSPTPSPRPTNSRPKSP